MTTNFLLESINLAILSKSRVSIGFVSGIVSNFFDCDELNLGFAEGGTNKTLEDRRLVHFMITTKNS